MYYSYGSTTRTNHKLIRPFLYPSQKLKNASIQIAEDDEKLCCWSKGETLMEQFCVDSSLHGLKYLGQSERTVAEKLFWLVAFLLSITGCVFIILALWNKYWSSPVVTVFQPTETPIDLIPFPAITVCNVNNVRRSRAQQYIKRAQDKRLSHAERLDAYADLYDLNHICEASTTFAQTLNVSERRVIEPELIDEVLKIRSELPPTDPVGVLRQATQNCSELILLCMWLDEVQPCNTLFHGVETDYGFCCTFNLVPLTLLLKYRNDSRDEPQEVQDWLESTRSTQDNILQPAMDAQKGELIEPLPKYPLRQAYQGRSSGLSLLLDPDLDEYFCTNTDAAGFVIGTTHPLDFPQVRDHGIAVRPNSETFMSIKPDLTVADPKIFAYDVSTRQCYTKGEKYLRYYTYYTSSNCVDECIANHTFQVCNCLQYYMPRSDDQQLCPPELFECTERVRKNIIQKGLLQECDTCLPPCSDVLYDVETTFLSMHNGVFSPEKFQNTNKSLNGRNLTIVHLYMGVDSSYPRLRKELYTVIDLISATGGLLSLCLGFSLLSVLEICYFSIIRVCMSLYKKYHQAAATPLFPSTFLE